MAWNKPFNAKITKKYDVWMADGAHSFTAARNMRCPPLPEIFKWVLEAWETLDRELIIRSFRSCALTVAPDGSEDDQIHCLKERQQDHPASIQQALTASCATDPFSDVTLSDVEEAAPESSLIELSDDDIEVD